MFFVRHNGGSVWFDDLGGDWPKHGCFDTGPSYRRLRDRLVLPTPAGVSYSLGVITEVFELVRMERARLVVRCSDGTLMNREFLTTASLEPLLGQMVIVTRRGDGSVTLTAAPADEPQAGATQVSNPMRWFIASSPGSQAPEQGRQG
ncbi:MAG: hypothetical protein K2X82_33235 [Gemmataceae bacterium]|nr:hypothetical protein [Gemmataceae bacterium]